MPLKFMGQNGICRFKQAGGSVVVASGEESIRAAVGETSLASNFAADVKTVQNLLNKVSTANGGPLVPLAVDGICGPKTKAAIRGFQERRFPKADGRIDPNGPTFRLLKEKASGLPSQVPGVTAHIAAITGILSASRAALQLAKFQVGLGNSGLGGLGGGNPVIAKLNKHFLLDQQPDPVAAIEEISSVYFDMQSAIGFIPTGFTLFADDPSGDDSFAFTTAGGFSLPKRFEVLPNNGVPVSSATIFLCSPLRTMDEDGITYIMIHEMAHFVGPPDGAQPIDDFAHHLSPRYQTLAPDKRLRNAECYAQFAFDVINRPFRHDQHVLR